MATTRPVTVRLSEEQLSALEVVARFDGVALAEELRQGVELLLAARRDDPAFRERVLETFEQAREILEGAEGGKAVIEALKPSVVREAEAEAVAEPSARRGQLA